jgi:hypothetical protein
MLPTVSVSALTLIFIFAGGVVVGLLARNVRIGGSVSVTPTSDASAGPSFRVAKRVIRELKVKCKCGEMLRFRDPIDPADPECQPFPKDDSVPCPHCGNPLDLREAKQIAGER